MNPFNYLAKVRKLLTAGTAIKILLEKPDIVIIKYAQMKGGVQTNKEKKKKKRRRRKRQQQQCIFL